MEYAGTDFIFDWFAPYPCTGNCFITSDIITSLHWRHNGRDGISNHRPHVCLLDRSFRRISKKASKFRVTGLWNSPVTGEFPAQMASNAVNISMGWRHHDIGHCMIHITYSRYKGVHIIFHYIPDSYNYRTCRMGFVLGTISYVFNIVFDCLTHCGLMTSHGDIKLGQNWLK